MSTTVEISVNQYIYDEANDFGADFECGRNDG